MLRSPMIGTARVTIMVAATLLAATSVASCGSGESNSSAKVSAPSVGEHPDLSGETVRIVLAAATPSVKDTTLALQAEILESWGAKSGIINQPGSPAAVRAVLAGQGEVASLTGPSIISGKMVAFGPSQPTLDYHLIAAADIKSFNDLKDRLYGTSNTKGLEAMMWAGALQNKGIDPKDIRVRIIPGSAAGVTAMLSKQLDATWVHAYQLPTLKEAGLSDLGAVGDLAPGVTGPFTAATKKWLDANPQLAVAVDQAWIEAVRIFHDDKERWIKAAAKFSGATEEVARTQYDELMELNLSPLSPDAFTADAAAKQTDVALKIGALDKPVDLDSWVMVEPWTQAVKLEELK